MGHPIVITSGNGRVGILSAAQVLRAGGSALGAVEAGIRAVELNADDHSVGLGGLPNLLGEVELDAGIMDGRTRAVGAVAAVRGFLHPISIARQVMERLPHVLLAGAGAERFAQEIGAERRELLTPEAERIWSVRLSEALGMDPDQVRRQPALAELVCRVLDDRPLHPHAGVQGGGTVDYLALDGRGDLAVGVSTSGLAWKYPGRVGDSPLAGAGYYADNRYGAAGCTGTGELAIRAGTARSAVFCLQMGYDLERAGRTAVADLASLTSLTGNGMSVLLLDPQGRAMGFSNSSQESYWSMTPEMEEPEEHPRVMVPMN